jgi:hypothetical protein
MISFANNVTTTFLFHNAESSPTSDKFSSSLVTASFPVETHTSTHNSKPYFTSNAPTSDRSDSSSLASPLCKPSDIFSYPTEITKLIGDDSQIFIRTITYCFVCSDTGFTISPTPYLTPYTKTDNDSSRRVVTESATYFPPTETSAPDISVKPIVVNPTEFAIIAVTTPMSSKLAESYISFFSEDKTENGKTSNLKTSYSVSPIAGTAIETISSSKGIISPSIKTPRKSAFQANIESIPTLTVAQTSTRTSSKDASSEIFKTQEIEIAGIGIVTKSVEFTPLFSFTTNLAATTTKAVTVISSSTFPRKTIIAQVNGVNSKVFSRGSYLMGCAGLIGFLLVI